LQVMDDKNLIALVETRTQGDDPGPVQLIRYQFGNHLGSANLELDHQAQIISYEEYTPFGSTSYQAVRSQTETPKRYRYTGKERDEESGLYYHGARYYAPWLGRWTAADPVWHPGSSYNYAENNPVLLSDPTGRDVPLYADFGGEHVHGQGMLRSGQIGTGNARLRMHPNGNYYLAEGYTPDVRNPLERAIVNYELTGDESFLDEVDAKMKGSGTSHTWRALSWNAAARHAGKDIRTDGQWWAVVGGAVLLMMGVAMTSRAGSSMRPAMSKEERIAAQHRQAVASRKAEAARRAKAEFQRKAKAYREAVFKTGEPSTVEPRVHRAGERPYTIPKDMQVAGPGRRVDVGKLDTSKKYLWVVTKSGEVRIAAESQPGLGRPLKHGDLVPGPGGQYRGHARAGGELYFDQSQGVWVMNNDSSFTFARAAGKWTPGSNPNAPWTSGQKGTVVSPWSSAESLQASKQLLQMTGTDTSKIVTQDVLAAQR
ncbi:MAG TPA: RHS repeat-associated core domain-containing protein, partial [Acidobacteriota bacterium]|nr:RHS repeat-associated core domain-containing protein [Acidobacteriota bacterium]